MICHLVVYNCHSPSDPPTNLHQMCFAQHMHFFSWGTFRCSPLRLGDFLFSVMEEDLHPAANTFSRPPGIGSQLQYLRIHPRHITSTLTLCQSRGWASHMPLVWRDFFRGRRMGVYCLYTCDLWPTPGSTHLDKPDHLPHVFFVSIRRSPSFSHIQSKAIFKYRLGVFKFSMSVLYVCLG